MIRTVVIDDEPAARRRLCDLLSSESDFEIAAEFGRGAAAVRELPSIKPDLVFLDVQMPGMSGFEIMESVDRRSPPEMFFVMVTAFDHYAVRAFEENIIDYLLKPFDRERFGKTVERVRGYCATRSGGPEPARAASSTSHYLTRLAVKSAGRFHFIRISEIDWMASEGNYVRLHSGKESHLFRGTIAGFEGELDPAQFVRISRATIVNVDRIIALEPSFQRDHLVTLRDGTSLRLLAPYRRRMQAIVGGF